MPSTSFSAPDSNVWKAIGLGKSAHRNVGQQAETTWLLFFWSKAWLIFNPVYSSTVLSMAYVVFSVQWRFDQICIYINYGILANQKNTIGTVGLLYQQRRKHLISSFQSLEGK